MTFAEFKRSIKVGDVLTCEHHARPEISGPRPVVKVQTNAIAYTFAHPERGTIEGWCYWGKAPEYRMGERSATHIDEAGRPIFTYTLAAA